MITPFDCEKSKINRTTSELKLKAFKGYAVTKALKWGKS